jgi:hypothetical protein
MKTDIANAPAGVALLLAIPTGDPEQPVDMFTGFVDEETGRFDGSWRYTEGLEEMEPIAYEEIEEPGEEVMALAREFLPAEAAAG